MYKMLVRPVLTYGAEVLYLTKSDADILKRTEGNSVKAMMNLSRNSKTTHLLGALKIEPLVNRLKIQKMNFFNRLNQNDLTRELTNKLIVNNNQDSNKFIFLEVLDIINTTCNTNYQLNEIQGPEKENIIVENYVKYDWILNNTKEA